MKSFNYLYLSATLLFLHLFASQTNGQDAFAAIPERFKQFNSSSTPEKLYVHTDKSFYLAGELLWFKIYSVDGARHLPADLSKIAYVEILDKENKPVMQAKIHLRKGKGNGSFYLPVSVTSGNYKLRAYTNWMKNFSAAYYFEKTLSIVNTLKTLTTPAADTTAKLYRVAFFPEGGNLVKETTSKIAFQVTDALGNGVDCKGVVLSENNDTSARFQTLRFGMGNFMFTPAGTQSYKAVILLPDGQSITQTLPQAYEQGYVMHLEDEGTGVIKVTVTAKAMQPQPVFLFAHNRQVMQVAEKQPVFNGVATFSFDKNKLADGITTLTVFNEQQQPVCERLYFKRPAQVLSVTASSNAPRYGNRKRVALSVNTKHGNAQSGVQADLSLAVYRLDSLQTVDPNNLPAYLWLTSELTGHIESPAWYFTEAGDVKEATENLMLVHGWRKFNWQVVLNDKRPAFEYTPEFDGHIITCQIKHNSGTIPENPIDAWLSIPGIQLQFYNTKTDKEGKIYFDVRDYYGQNEIIVQTDAPDSNYRVNVLNPFSEKYSNRLLPPFALPAASQYALNEHSIGMQVLNTYDPGKLSHFAIPEIDTFPFYGKPYKVYKLDDYTRFTTMEEVLREYVPEVAVRRWDGQLHLKVFNFEVRDFYPTEPLILLDGVKVNNHILLNYDPLKVNRLEVTTNKFIKGEFVYHGIVNFTTYHGDMQDLKLDSKAVILDYEGLQLKREFYSPVYKTEQQALSRMPDFRNLLYWSPDVQTDSSGQATVEFYTSDMKGKYVAVLQGMDEADYAGSYYFTFDVDK
ncbi:hypothetical protein [Niastella populi]|uniref:Macroglobulin domain-containing protein n=1 Tax=Niastella populi TaxID=550983 RepID=A0A1V9ETM7_9BACT|nr:hypothetical protein [Niastella populi]OQP49431.1 hypothetical protein A4R26_30650 [Niastella populi]